LSRPPQAITTVNPKWPSAKNLGPHYLVTLEFTVETDGKVRDIHAVGSMQEEHFVAEAKDAVGQWQFEPGEKDGAKVVTHLRITIPFKAVTKDTRPSAFEK